MPPVHLEGPAPGSWAPVFSATPKKKPAASFTHVARVTELSVPLYAGPRRRKLVGYTGLGSRVPARPLDKRCRSGEWLAVSGDAYLCSGDGVRLVERGAKDAELEAWVKRRLPRVDRPTLYRAAKARSGAPLFARLPTKEELRLLERHRPPKGLVRRHIQGTLLMAWVRTIDSGPEPFLELLSGELIRAADVEEHFPDTAMRGEALGEDVSLPLAFAWDNTPVYCVDEERAEPCGLASKHARFPGDAVVELHEQELVMVGEGLAVPRKSVRMAKRISRPSGVGSREQWIHIDLTEQTLVAYEGDTPVRATLVSTGLPEAATPRGLYQVNRIYQSKPMNGVDALGPYQVQQVPWTMFFRGNYAVHGAYWHDAFGGPRSHGCVNVPPADARWLYHWSKPRLPMGWTASLRVRGPRIFITGETPEVAPAVATRSQEGRRDARALD